MLKQLCPGHGSLGTEGEGQGTERGGRAVTVGSGSPQMTGDPAGSLQDPRLPGRAAHLHCTEGWAGGFPGTYPGVVACSPAHLVGWDQPHGPGAAALETAKPAKSCWRTFMDWILTPTLNLAKEASSKCGTLNVTRFSTWFCPFHSVVHSLAHLLPHSQGLCIGP